MVSRTVNARRRRPRVALGAAPDWWSEATMGNEGRRRTRPSPAPETKWRASPAAIGYALNQREAPRRFLTDGRLEIDNSGAERALRGTAVGRSDCLFAGIAAGGHRAATLCWIVETCRRQAIDPYRYMRDVLGRLPTRPKDAFADLTPKGWKRAFPELAAAATTAPAQERSTRRRRPDPPDRPSSRARAPPRGSSGVYDVPAKRAGRECARPFGQVDGRGAEPPGR